MTKFNRLLICASPRKKGTSMMLLERIEKSIGGKIIFLPQKGSFDEIVNYMQKAETIIISGPTYINSYPARLYELLEFASNNYSFNNQKLYGIINGGMPYIHTHEHGLRYLKLFAQENNLKWMGGFVLTTGAILDGQPLEKHLNSKKVIENFDKFVNCINQQVYASESLSLKSEYIPPKFMVYIISKILTYKVVRNLKAFGHHPDESIGVLEE